MALPCEASHNNLEKGISFIIYISYYFGLLLMLAQLSVLLNVNSTTRDEAAQGVCFLHHASFALGCCLSLCRLPLKSHLHVARVHSTRGRMSLCGSLL